MSQFLNICRKITHLYSDHFGGLPFFILDAQLVSKRTDPLVIAGPPSLEHRICEAMEILFPGSSKVQLKFAMEFVEFPEGIRSRIGTLTVTAYRVVHTSGTAAYALRIARSARVIAYSGDTEWPDALFQAAQGADLFICEAYSFDKKMKYHLDCETLM